MKTSVLVLIYFLILYSFQVPGIPLGSAMMALFVLAICTAYELFRGNVKFVKTKTTKDVRSYLLWNIFLFVYVFCILQIRGCKDDSITPLKDYVQLLIILPFFYISGNLLFGNVKNLMTVLYAGAIIQSLIIIVALFSPVITIALALLFPEGAFNTDQLGGFEGAIAQGYHIGLGVFSSAGSLKIAIGQIGAVFYLTNSRGSKLCLHLMVYIMIAIATTVVARTGLIISIAGLSFVFYIKRKQGGRQSFGFIALVSLILLIGYISTISFLPSDFMGDTFKRLVDTADRGVYDTYFKGYTGEGGNNTIPPISLETLIGLGITQGVSGSGIMTITDGGFMRNYSAMGLVIAIVNYSIIVSFFIRRLKNSKSYIYKGIVLFMSFVFLFGEFKEYYIYYISPICFAFLIFNMMEKDEIPSSHIRPSLRELKK